MTTWERLRSFTKARIGLKVSGSSLATCHHLDILKAQALARDALWRPWSWQALKDELQSEENQPVAVLSTPVTDRKTYLARPDLGRILSEHDARTLASQDVFGSDQVDTRIVFCVSDGLSAEAMVQHMRPFLRVFLPRLSQESFYRGRPFPFFIIPYSRVAVVDHVGEILKCDLSVIFVGERPGISSHDSMGIYLTHKPRRGSHDGLRNCISNVRPPEGLTYELASAQLLYLIRESLNRGLSGVDLKMESETLLIPSLKAQIAAREGEE